MDHAVVCDELEAEAIRVAGTLARADLGSRVPTCPEWTVRDLAEHMARGQRWATLLVETRATTFAGIPEADDMPETAGGVGTWIREIGTRLAGACRAAGADTPVWSWSADQTARFWARRMLHETQVHGADASIAIGGTPSIDAALAADGIAEFLEILPALAQFSPGRDLQGNGESIHFHCTDTEGEWTAFLTPTGLSVERGHGKATAALRGPASDLFLVVNRRLAREASSVETFGDEALVARWLANTAF